MTTVPIRKSLVFRIAVVGLLMSIAVIVPFGAYLLIFEPPHNRTRNQLLVSMFVIGLQFLLWTGAAVAGRTGVWKAILIIASLVTVIGSGLWLGFIWYESVLSWEQEEELTRWIIFTLLLGGAIIHTGVIWKLPGKAFSLNILRGLTSAGVWIITLFAVSIAAAEEYMQELIDSTAIDGFLLLGVLALVALCGGLGTVLVPILSLNTSRSQHKSEWLRRDIVMQLNCPRCQHEQKLGQGYSRCSNCRATIFIEFEEPRCACGYLLFELQGNTCPECGREIAQHVTSDPVTPPPIMKNNEEQI